mmetsp:Transcript_155492/g.274578  ORF Transcript_155492/g.274578 Transcript_155492/m.274578 type:complete len:239 (-) Transcript_155492:32-748(-)
MARRQRSFQLVPKKFSPAAARSVSVPGHQGGKALLALPQLPFPLKVAFPATMSPVWRWAMPTATTSSIVRCEDCDEKYFIHEEHWNPAMWGIVGSVDFRSLLEEASFVLEGVAPEIIERLVDFGGTKVFATKGSYLLKQGTENTKIIILGQGQLGAQVDGQQIGYVVPGQMIGEFAFIKKEPAFADVVVESDLAYFLVLDHSSVSDILGEHPEVLCRMRMLMRQRELQKVAHTITSRK